MLPKFVLAVIQDSYKYSSTSTTNQKCTNKSTKHWQRNEIYSSDKDSATSEN